jgi:RNA polymerase sigma-70 factor (ECF subfamily)
MDDSRSQASLADRSDEELFDLVRQRAEASSRAFDELFRRHHGTVYRWCLKTLNDVDWAEDVTQSVFVELWCKTKPYESQGRFGAWLYVLVRNRCLNARRFAQRRPTEELDDALAQVLQARGNPESEYAVEEFDERVREICARHLDAQEQAVIHLRYHWGLKVKEITDLLDLTNASGARSYLRSAEEKLRRHMRGLRGDLEGGVSP